MIKELAQKEVNLVSGGNKLEEGWRDAQFILVGGFIAVAIYSIFKVEAKTKAN